ncbi:hypothetical protein [Azospirillum rugosum]|uniref:Tyrosine specific protein phosphatases domain-containing protein n=1 Tax=Azospirillum rugosum TaxID=416170 RepID=A0ABS4SWI4_9PROT|nr:hypothetical protein [Azospirillum rugosum]MBP2296614.1 putative protein tyrosine phosphatase [Azospirillum rugosum]MDQ0530327.1 putative protein tyrosine phosphatase [Azospirillum rugosum]
MGREGFSTAVVPFSIRICGLREAETVVRAFVPTNIIAISDPYQGGMPVPDEASVLRLSFWDLDRESAVGNPMSTALSRRGLIRMPQVGDIQAILEFGRSVSPGGQLLCCCGAGRSRSAAAAVIAVAQAMPGYEEQAVVLIRQIRPEARPNSLMIRLADELIGAGGWLPGSLGRAGDWADHSS